LLPNHIKPLRFAGVKSVLQECKNEFTAKDAEMDHIAVKNNPNHLPRLLFPLERVLFGCPCDPNL
jgi:hypothetical protein